MSGHSTLSQATIRQVELQDFDRVAEIINARADEDFTGAILRERYSSWQPEDPRLAVVAEHEGQVVAYANARRRQGEPEGKFTTMVYLDEAFEHQGLGRELG